MKKILSLILALTMLCSVALAETPDLIGGADGPTSIFVLNEWPDRQNIIEKAIAAGRKVTVDASIAEFSGVSTDDEKVDAALADLIKALGFHAALQGDEVNMGLSMTGKDVLTLGVAANGNDAYIKSNLIGGTVVLSAEEIEPLAGRLIDMLVLMEAMSEKEAADVKKEIAEAVKLVREALEQAADTAFTQEDLLSLDYSALTKAIADIAADVEDVQEIVVPRMCDQAASGKRLSISNEEFIAVLKACLQFVKDNPKLMDYMAAQSGAPTQEAIDNTWEDYGDMYMKHGIYASEEEYREANKTFLQSFEDSMAELDQAKLLDGDFVTTVYLNDQDEVVYLTSVLPMFSETERVHEGTDGAEATGTTQILNLVYTRQTLADAVSHICNIDVDGNGISVEVLSKGNALNIVVGIPAEQKTILTIDAVTEDGVTKGTYTTDQEEADWFQGTFSFSHAADDSKLQTAFAFDMEVNSVTTVEVKDDSLSSRVMGKNATTTETKTETHRIGLAYTCDYALSGVDFNGTELIGFSIDDMKFAFKIDAATSDPADSIMTGNVVRPAELDDAAFANWFVGVYSSLMSWGGTLMTALPESVLLMLLSSGALN